MLTAMPFTGHVTPLRAVAAALAARGHDVRFYTGAAFREPVESTGSRLVPWRAAPDFDENDISATFPRLLGEKGIRQLLINVQDVFIRTAPAQVEDLTAEWDRAPWDAIAGVYKTRDGFVRLHTNFLHHRDAVCKVLNCEPERDAVQAAPLWPAAS